MKVLLHTFGTAGDNSPFLALGSALLERGAKPIMLVNPAQEAAVRARGLDYRGVGDHWSIDEVEDAERYLHPRTGGIAIWKELCIPNMTPAFAATKAAIEEERPDLYVGHFLCWGGLWAARAAGLPTAVVSLAPCWWYSKVDPSIYSPSVPPRFAMSFSIWVARRFTNALIGKPASSMARSLGVPFQSDEYFANFERADLNLGLWSPSFRGPASDDPPHSVICGFPWDGGYAGDASLSPEVERFLEGEAPVVVGLGTSARAEGEKVYRAAAEAALERGARVLVVGAELGISDERALCVPAAPYARVFPRAQVIVHHGGAGTTAEALRAGRPSVILPFANDQFDNARRAEGLGVSTTARRQVASSRSLQTALERALERADAARDLGARIAAEPDGAVRAAERILESAT